MSHWRGKPYVPVGVRRKAAESAAASVKRGNTPLCPIAPSRGAIAKTFWGKAWCDNLERYSDFANRLPRGRTYLRNGSVIDLAIGQGEVRAQVMGSRLYRVQVRVAAVGDKRWKAIGSACSGSIDSVVELLQGTFSSAVMQRLCRAGDGLFPAPKEIEFSCSCPDWASMCKHVAAVLYGVGARLDQRPELLFQLRRVDGNDLLAHADTGMVRRGKVLPKARVLDNSALGDVFGIEMAGDATPTDSVQATAGQPQRKKGAGAAKAASKVVAEASTSGLSASKVAAAMTTTSSTSRRHGAYNGSVPQRIRTPHVRQAAPTGMAAKQKKRKRNSQP